ncbi:cell division regulator GpsB [Catellicoccus marimammalium]|uniref:Cell division protein GpsB n=1 Tax=Catellicoccus marimammalium M35/04/3 TaxID=1234409 RepID=K8ZNR3_9ENTE|nr:cell division regulator GpsB [Catellicoccus marimammalium]EKU27236.1 Cell division protein GpsB [Catellicoccus marimammalium M35/04/3]
MPKVIHTADEILQKDFDIKMRGYDQVEVDQYLDEIIKDYGTFQRQIAQLKDENARLKAEVEKLNREQELYSQAPKQNQTVTNFDILKRLSNLERKVFGNQLDQ